MKRALLIGTAAVAALVVGTLVVVVIYLDAIARGAIERGASYALGVETHVASTRIGLLSGSFSLVGIEIANPPGFEEASFLRVGKARLDLDMATLREQIVKVPELAIQGVEVDLDKRGGQANYAAILDNLGRFESKEPAPARDPGTAPERRFVVQRVAIRDVEAHVRAVEVGPVGKIDLVVPEVVLQDVGGGGEGLTAAQLSGVVVKAVLASLAKAGVGLPGGIASALSGRLGRLAKVSIELPEGGGLRDAATGAAGAGAEAARDAAGRVLGAGRSALDAGKRKLEDAGGKRGDR